MTAPLFKLSVVSRDSCQAPIATTARRSSADRIRLLGTLDDPAPITLCTTDTVAAVRQQRTWAQVDVVWDNGLLRRGGSPPQQLDSHDGLTETMRGG
jgi:hypothetical protein